MYGTGADNIDSGRVYTAMAEDVGELGDVFLDPVERSGKQVPEIMQKDFSGVDVRFLTELLHLTPYIRPAYWLAGLGDENCTVIYTMFLCIFEQFFLQTADDDDCPSLALAVDGCKSPLDSFNRDKLQFADTDPCAANCLKNE